VGGWGRDVEEKRACVCWLGSTRGLVGLLVGSLVGMGMQLGAVEGMCVGWILGSRMSERALAVW